MCSLRKTELRRPVLPLTRMGEAVVLRPVPMPCAPVQRLSGCPSTLADAIHTAWATGSLHQALGTTAEELRSLHLKFLSKGAHGPCRDGQIGHDEPQKPHSMTQTKDSPKEAPLLARCALRPGVVGEDQCDKSADAFAIRGMPYFCASWS